MIAEKMEEKMEEKWKKKWNEGRSLERGEREWCERVRVVFESKYWRFGGVFF